MYFNYKEDNQKLKHSGKEMKYPKMLNWLKLIFRFDFLQTEIELKY